MSGALTQVERNARLLAKRRRVPVVLIPGSTEDRALDKLIEVHGDATKAVKAALLQAIGAHTKR